MKLVNILEKVNSFEKNSFLKIMDIALSCDKVDNKKVDAILTSSDKDLKNADLTNIVKIFNLIEEQYKEHLVTEMKNISSQLDVVIDILIRDGNSIMKYEWFSKLYEKELKELKQSIKSFDNDMNSDKTEINTERKRDYTIYKACLHTAYNNDLLNNQDPKISDDEQSILITLSEELNLSQQELKIIKYLIVALKKQDLDELINELKNIGIVFYSKKTKTIYIPNEIISLLRQIKNRPVADKYFKRVLKQLREPELNIICKNHNIKYIGVSVEDKISLIINSGVRFRELLTSGIHKEGTTLNEKKAFINELVEKGLQLSEPLRGITVEDKVSNLIDYYVKLDKDDKVGIPLGGYQQLLIDIDSIFGKNINSTVKKEFELQDENVLDAEYLLDYNIKPRDIIELLSVVQLKQFCKENDKIKVRGNLVVNILDAYKDMRYLEFENYINIGFRDLNALKENGLKIKESDIGVKFEDITKTMLSSLGMNVDEEQRKKLNTAKDKIDILINLGNDEIIIVECKTSKESGYNKFSSVSRQIKSYVSLAEKSGKKVVKSLLIAPDFSDDFVNECELDYILNLSLIKAESLKTIVEAFEHSKLKIFPYNLLMRDVLIKGERIIKAIQK
ncbi:MAG: hypothetical protein COA44_04295 [Arcobacter sp.]|nr:MAG: hypothetical protein COA44_04295 [Arcobacter sp.]